MLCGQSVLVLEQVQYDELACQLVTEVIRSNWIRLGIDTVEFLDAY